MYCPKCGTENPKDGSFCRKCGTDLSLISDALGGSWTDYTSDSDGKKKEDPWESAFGSMFMGFAFLIVAAILGFSGAAGGRHWWFWLLIPAFSMLGAGFSKWKKSQHNQKMRELELALVNSQNGISEGHRQSLPEGNAVPVSMEMDNSYQTGELVPPSVVERTTRHLEMNKEGETMTLPKKDKIT